MQPRSRLGMPHYGWELSSMVAELLVGEKDDVIYPLGILSDSMCRVVGTTAKWKCVIIGGDKWYGERGLIEADGDDY